MTLAAVEEELSATREELAALKAAVPEIDLKVTALQAEVENLDLGYKVVTSGRDCKYITTKEQCSEAAKALGFATTEVTESSCCQPRPPGCRYRSESDQLYFNTDPDANGDCGDNGDGKKWDCICKK